MQRMKKEVEREILAALEEENIGISTDLNGRIHVVEINMDDEAQAGMLYLVSRSSLPAGKKEFLVSPSVGVYGIFHCDGQAVMIEVSSYAMEGVEYPPGLEERIDSKLH